MMFRIVDFEASGDAPDGEVIEVGWVDMLGSGALLEPVSLLIRPTKPINIETMAVHHLRAHDLADGLTRDDAFASLGAIPDGERDLFGASTVTYVAHSAKFEQAWWPECTGPWICTYKCALKLWPESPRHSNQVIRYFLDLDLPERLAMPPHRAAPDAYVTANILLRMLDLATPEQLIQWSSEPAVLPRVNFGMHRGKSWQEVDDGFLHWVVVRDFDEDVLHTVRVEIERRRQQAAASAPEPVTADEEPPF